MSAFSPRGFVLLVLIVPLAGVAAAPPDDAEIARLIKQLDSDDFDMREAAGKQLEAIGEPIRPVMEKVATTGGDLETRARAVKVIQALNAKLQVLCYDLHSEEILSVAFTPDGEHLISASRDGTVRMLEARTGKLIHCFAHPAANCVAVSRDGSRAISGGYGSNQSLRLWDLESGKELRRYGTYSQSVYGVAFSSDGKQVLYGALDDKAPHLLDLESGEVIRRFPGHTGGVVAIALSSDGKQCFSASHDSTVRVWNTETGKELICFHGPLGAAGAAAVSPDGTRAVSGGERTIELWEAKTGKPIRTMELPASAVSWLAFSGDGRRIASANYEGKTVSLWDAETGKEIHRFEGHTDKIRCVAISPDGRFLVSCGYDKTVRVWRVPK